MAGLEIAWLNQLDIFHPWAGGAEKHCIEVSRRLVQRGHRVTIFSERHPGLAPTDSLDGIRIVRPAGRIGLHVWARKNLGARAPPAFDVTIHDLSKVLPWQLRPAANSPTVAIVRHLNGRILMREAPVFTGPAFWAAERYYRTAYRHTPVVTEAQATKRQLVECGLEAGQVQIVRPGVDRQMFHPDPTSKSQVPEILSVGRLKAYKGVDLAIRSFQKVRETFPDAHLTVTGRGPEQERLERLADRLDLRGSVTFTGFVDPGELARLYQQAWVHVQPSVVEGWGYTVIEAAACGTPTVAFRCGALPESVGPVSEPFLTSERNEAALATSLVAILRALRPNPSLYVDALTEYAREFDWDRTTSAYERLLYATSRIGGPEPNPVGVPVPGKGWTRSR